MTCFTATWQPVYEMSILDHCFISLPISLSLSSPLYRFTSPSLSLIHLSVLLLNVCVHVHKDVCVCVATVGPGLTNSCTRQSFTHVFLSATLALPPSLSPSASSKRSQCQCVVDLPLFSRLSSPSPLSSTLTPKGNLTGWRM